MLFDILRYYSMFFRVIVYCFVFLSCSFVIVGVLLCSLVSFGAPLLLFCICLFLMPLCAILCSLVFFCGSLALCGGRS